MSDVLVIGVGGHVVAIDPATGTELWRKKLKDGQFVSVLLAGSRIIAGVGGELFCLDKATGQLLWKNKLPRLGMGLVALGSTVDPAGVALAASCQAAAAAAAGAAAASAAS